MEPLSQYNLPDWYNFSWRCTNKPSMALKIDEDKFSAPTILTINLNWEEFSAFAKSSTALSV